MVERQAIVDAIEGSIFTLPDVPGVNTVLAIPGIAAMHGLLPSPEVNAVGKARLAEEDVDATVERVKEVFQEAEKVCGWWISPNSRPEDLTEHLTRAGFAPEAQAAGMVLTDLDTPIATNPTIRVERALTSDLAGAAPMMARAYGIPEEAGTLFAQFIAGIMEHTDYRIYLAYAGDSPEPIAWSGLLFLQGVPIVVLQGAGTLPEHRGQGIYRSMVAHRLQDARERGTQAAVMQANRESSAPIAEKLGFLEVLPLTLYAWDPASSE